MSLDLFIGDYEDWRNAPLEEETPPKTFLHYSRANEFFAANPDLQTFAFVMTRNTFVAAILIVTRGAYWNADRARAYPIYRIDGLFRRDQFSERGDGKLLIKGFAETLDMVLQLQRRYTHIELYADASYQTTNPETPENVKRAQSGLVAYYERLGFVRVAPQSRSKKVHMKTTLARLLQIQ